MGSSPTVFTQITFIRNHSRFENKVQKEINCKLHRFYGFVGGGLFVLKKKKKKDYFYEAKKKKKG